MILVTGGAGYIGSHTCVELLNAGKEVVVLDNFSNSSRSSLERVQRICGKPLTVVERDIRDQASVEKVLADFGCTAVIHFAGLKSVLDSVTSPSTTTTTMSLAPIACCGPCRRATSSASSSVRPRPCLPESQFLPYTEDHPLNPVNPYGQTKLVVEEMLRDLFISDPGWSIGILRYFNPIGAHESGLIGEDPKGVPNNLLPFVAQVAVGRRERLECFRRRL